MELPLVAKTLSVIKKNNKTFVLQFPITFEDNIFSYYYEEIIRRKIIILPVV